MDDARSINGGQTFPNLNGHGESLLPRQSPALQQFLQGLSLKVLFNDVIDVRAIRTGLGTNVINGRNIRVVKGRGGLGLTLEASKTFWRGCSRGGQHFDRYLAMQPGVLSKVNFPHAALPNLLQNLVVGNR